MASAATHLAMEWKACGKRRKVESGENLNGMQARHV